MLVLSRKVGERIVIGDSIEVRLVAVGRGRATVGITAPVSVPIRRSELAPKVHRATGPAKDNGCGAEEALLACW
jgi:carbon storage regulator